MEYLKIEGEFPKLANCAVTMGKFDGIHRGHRKLVEKIRERKTLGEQAVLFAIDASSNMILTSQERASLLEKLGVDVLVEVVAFFTVQCAYTVVSPVNTVEVLIFVPPTGSVYQPSKV